MIMPAMKNNPLVIPLNKQVTGLTVYCRLCATNVSEGSGCKKDGVPLHKCKHGDEHCFKIYGGIPGTNMRRTKTLRTRDLDEARMEAIRFMKEVKGCDSKNSDRVENKREIQRKEENRPNLLIHTISRYIGWLNNEDVPPHRQKVRSPAHIKETELVLKCFVMCLKDNGEDISSFTIEDINDDTVGKVFSYLEDRKLANRTFNKYFGHYTSFLKWYSEEYNYSTRNWFERVKRKKLNPNPEIITQKEYEALFEKITPENGEKEYENSVKPIRNLYRPWLADGIRLGLLTGRRREEIINLKWSDIQESEGIQVIKSEDLKSNRIRQRNTEAEKKFVYIPVTDSLQQLLNEMGYEKHKGTNKYILAPDVKINRKRAMSDVLTRGFSHYYDQLDTDRKLTFKCLRKTYITNLQIFMGNGNVRTITGHSGDQVLEHYIDRREIAKAARNFSVFPKEAEREDVLAEIRTESKNKQPQKELEV